jgi:hypothetical protein
VSAIKSAPDTNNIEFDYVDNLGGKTTGFVITNVTVVLLKRNGERTVIAAPSTAVPLDFHNAAVGSKKFVKMVFDTTGVASVAIKLQAYDVQAQSVLQMFLNGQRQNVPVDIVNPYSKPSDAIRIAPNPYVISSSENSLRFPSEPDKIAFFNIPGNCLISIYTELGELIKQIVHNDGTGDAYWNSITSANQVVVSGIYIVVFENKDTGEKTIKKLVIVR